MLAYLVFDLYILDGPLNQRIEGGRSDSRSMRELAASERWVALLNGRPLTRGQLDLAVAAYNFKRSIVRAELSPENRRLNQLAALDELIEDELLRSHAENTPLPLPEAEIDQALERFRNQFESEAEFDALLEHSGIPAAELRSLIASQLQQSAWIEHNIAAAIRVDDEEIRAFIEANPESRKVPERVRARQIFLSTVEKGGPERRKLIEEIHRKLLAGETSFAELARDFSEDPRSAKRGGDLDWFSRQRIDPAFAEVVFSLAKGEISPPFRTDIGWHIVELTERLPAREAAFEEIQAEVRQLFETEKRQVAVSEFTRRLRQNSVIELYREAAIVPEPEPSKPTLHPESPSH
ncbi:MAG: peptidylprolyl isomerase [Verrucomicrobiales bacterium]